MTTTERQMTEGLDLLTHPSRVWGLVFVLAFITAGCTGHPPLPPDPRYPMEFSIADRIALAKRSKTV